MKRTKRFLALLMCFVLCFSLISTSAFAEEAEAAMQDETSISTDAEEGISVEEEISDEENISDDENISDEEEIPVTEEQEITETEEVTIEEKAASDEKVRVTFVPDAEGTAIAVYQNNQLIQPVEDETYVYELLPGSYMYNTACTGYITVCDTELIVETAKEQTVEITSMELPSTGIYAQDLYGNRYFIETEASVTGVDPSAEEKVNRTSRNLYNATYHTSPSAFANATKSKVKLMKYGYYVSSTLGKSYDYNNATYMSNSDNEYFSAGYQYDGLLTDDAFSTILTEIEAAYKVHTGNPYEGDYIREALLTGLSAGYGEMTYSSETGYTTFELYIAPYYHTSAANQAAVESAADSLVSSLNLNSALLSDYDKLKIINTWLMENVRYGYADVDISHTVNYHNAYGSLVDKKAVCQGFSSAYYVLALKAGVDIRIITSGSMGHAWNLVKVGKYYYYCDSTWDSNEYDKGTEDTTDDGGDLEYFLQGTTHWADSHTRGDQYLSSYSYFDAANYPVPTSDYSGYTISYNLNGGSGSISATSSDGTASRITSTVPVRSGYQFDGWATSSSGSVAYASGALYTKCSSITLYAHWTSLSELKITSQPVSITVAEGKTATFKITASGTNLTYQWQYSKDNGTTWFNSGASGSTTASVKFTATKAKNGQKYRCIVKNSYGKSVTSTAATLKVFYITQQPADQKAAVNESVSFSVAANGSGMTYQWQYSKDNGTTWINSSASTATTAALKVQGKTDRNGWKYRCIVKDSAGRKLTSTAATLTVFGIKTQPKSSTVKVGEYATFTVLATGKGLSYQWQYSKNNGKSWVNSSASTATTASIRIKATTTNNGYVYRCKITDTGETVIYSDKAGIVIVT